MTIIRIRVMMDKRYDAQSSFHKGVRVLNPSWALLITLPQQK